MQALKDAATLAVLILLALTVRIDINGAPLEIELHPPVDAAESMLPTDELPLPEAQGYKLEIVLDGEEATAPSQPTPIRFKPCNALLDPQFSS